MTEPYTAWANVPDHLKTKTQLDKAGLRLAKGQEPVAEFCSFIRGRNRPNFYKLYDLNEAIPKRTATEAQLAALAKAREAWGQARTCQRCGSIFGHSLKGSGGFCRFCRDHREAVNWAREALADGRAVILDTETTGLGSGAEIIEIAIITTSGETLLDTLVKPAGDIPSEATAIHGITQADVEAAPTWAEIDGQIFDVLHNASRIIIYNDAYDSRLLYQTRAAHGLAESGQNYFDYWYDHDRDFYNKSQCAMHWYAQWYGEWSDHHRSYRWQSLNGGHRALGDCLATLDALREMSEGEV